MAKKAKTSARSKGYRKTVQKKPFLTKKEIIILVAIVVVIALAILLFNLLYDDGSLDMVDGAPQAENIENSLLTSEVNGDVTKYFKVGEAGQIAGYTRERTPGYDENVPTYYYYPEDEASPLDSIRISGGRETAAELAVNAVNNYALNPTYLGTAPNGLQETEIDGRQVYYVVSHLEYVDTTAEAADETADTVDETADTVEETADAAGETANAAGETAETADETADTVEETADAADETTDTTQEAAEAADEASGEASEVAGPYICTQTLSAFVDSSMDDDHSVVITISLTGETETAVDAEGLAAYTEGLYLSDEDLLAYLEQAMQAVDPDEAAEAAE